MFKNPSQARAYFAKKNSEDKIIKLPMAKFPTLSLPQQSQINKIQPFIKLREKLKAFKSGGY